MASLLVVVEKARRDKDKTTPILIKDKPDENKKKHLVGFLGTRGGGLSGGTFWSQGQAGADASDARTVVFGDLSGRV
jgi:hypothetical protein